MRTEKMFMTLVTDVTLVHQFNNPTEQMKDI